MLLYGTQANGDVERLHAELAVGSVHRAKDSVDTRQLDRERCQGVLWCGRRPLSGIVSSRNKEILEERDGWPDRDLRVSSKLKEMFFYEFLDIVRECDMGVAFRGN